LDESERRKDNWTVYIKKVSEKKKIKENTKAPYKTTSYD